MKKKNWFTLLAIALFPISVFASVHGPGLVHINGVDYLDDEVITVENGGTNYKDGYRFEFIKDGKLDVYHWNDITKTGNIIVNGNNEIKRLFGAISEGDLKYNITGEGKLVIDEIYNDSPTATTPDGKTACQLYIDSRIMYGADGKLLEIACADSDYVPKHWDELREYNRFLPEEFSTDYQVMKQIIFLESGVIEDVESYVNKAITTTGKITIDGTKLTIDLTKTEDQKEIAFKDVKTNDWYYDSVKFAYENKIIMGYSNTQFAPSDKVTRGQLVTILWRLEGTPDASSITNKFSDVPSNDYFTSAVKWAEKNEIVHGYNAKKFGPNDPITRQDLAVILNNYAKFKELDAEDGENISTFADYSKVKGAYSEPALKWAVKNKVMSGQNINGKKYISPSSNATRAETAAMVTNFIQKFNLK